MDRLIARLSPLFHVTRVSTAFAAVGNVWFVVLWSRACPPERRALHAWPHTEVVDGSLWKVLLGSAIFALGSFAFAMALNDTVDARRDRALHPERPIPSGRLSLDAAVGLVVLALMAALAGALPLGLPPVVMAMGTIGVMMFYNTFAKFLPSVGLVALCLIYGGHMMTPNVMLQFVWPVWLVMTHALIVAGFTHHLGQRRPAITTSMVVSAGAGWLFWSAVLLVVGFVRVGSLWPDWVKPGAAIWVGCLAVAFILLAVFKVKRAGSPRRAAEKLHRYGMLWLTLYAWGWLFGQGLVEQAWIIGVLAALGFLGMTVLRELWNLIEKPVAYRL